MYHKTFDLFSVLAVHPIARTLKAFYYFAGEDGIAAWPPFFAGIFQVPLGINLSDRLCHAFGVAQAAPIGASPYYHLNVEGYGLHVSGSPETAEGRCVEVRVFT